MKFFPYQIDFRFKFWGKGAEHKPAAGDMIMQAGADFLELSDCGGQIPDLYKAALCWHISSFIFGFFHRAARPVSEMALSGIELHCEHTAGREAVIRMI